MPGILLHLTFGNMIYNKIGKDLNLDKSDFLSGCLIPDMTVDKKDSHYRVPASITRYLVPDMEKVKKDLFDVNNSLYLGIYCHLFLDYHFFEDYIFKKYRWENGYVTVPHSNYELSENEFFKSGSGIYASYGELNRLLLKSGKISRDDLSIINEYLPNTNIDKFDKRREKTWLCELNEYFITENEYSGKILDFESVMDFLERLTSTFIDII